MEGVSEIWWLIFKKRLGVAFAPLLLSSLSAVECDSHFDYSAHFDKEGQFEMKPRRRWAMAADLGQRASWMLWRYAVEAGVCKVPHYRGSSEYEVSGRPTLLPQRNKMKPLKNLTLVAVQGLYRRPLKEVLIRVTQRELLELFYFCYIPVEKRHLKEYSIYLLNYLFSSAPSNGVKSTAAKGSYIRKLSSAAMWCQCDKMMISL